MKNWYIQDENLYFIGGVVRDELLNLKPFDIDITYDGNAIEFCKNLEEKGLCKILKINEPFGTVRIVIDGKETDVASTRNEIYEKKGHLPKVLEIGCSLKKDVLRRDFTVNSLAKSTLTNQIIDYTNGVEDLKNKTLRILHDNSFTDDPTRIIRALKFAVRFGFREDEHTKYLQDRYLENINYDMSYKRVKKELIETFNLNSQKAYEEFFRQNIYKLLTKKTVIQPKYNIEELIKKYPVEHIWLVYLGWMNLSLLPLTKEEQKIKDDFNSLKEIEIKDDKYSIYKAFEGKTRESILLYTLTTNSDLGLKYFEIEDIKISINGDDLKKLGITPSKQYQICFDYILSEKLKNPTLSRDEEIKLAKEFFDR